jgi:hypothetical protein
MEGDYSPEMCKKTRNNFMITAIGSEVDSHNNQASCIIQVQKNGKVEVNAVLSKVLGGGLFDMSYIVCKGDFDI